MNKKKVFKRIALVILACVIAAILGVGGFVIYHCWKLPQINSLNDYHPKEATYVYSQDGETIAVFAEQRRTVVDVASLPKHVIQAFLAAEDAKFYEHEGLNYVAIGRALFKDIFLGSHQGASTITQQTVKNMVVGAEHSIRRKVQEAVLSKRLEDMLTKDEILHLYLNEIYFGNGAYGIEEASRLYFNCSAKDLTIKEAALLASAPKSPLKYTTLGDAEATDKRHKWVLEQMVSNGFITAEQARQAGEEKITRKGRLAEGNYPLLKAESTGAYYVEQVRRQVIDVFSDMKIKPSVLMEGGLKIYTVMDTKAQRYAEASFRQGLEKFARNQGWRGPLWRIEVDQFDTAYSNLHAAFDTQMKRWETFYQAPPAKENKPVWDLSQLVAADVAKESSARSKMVLRPLQAGKYYVGLVTAVDGNAKKAEVDLGNAVGVIPFKGLEWARPNNNGKIGAVPQNITQILSKGDIVLVKVLQHNFSKQQPKAFDLKESMVPGTVAALKEVETLQLELVPWPKVDGALISMEPQRGWVKAMVGGYDQLGVGFNRATQAKRQPGSTFKPIVYTAAIKNKIITPATLCPDTPYVSRDKYTGKDWRPTNSDGKYDGDIRYRVALAKSKNICSVKAVELMGAEAVVDAATEMGITSKLPHNLTIALGTGEVTPLEMVTAYSTLASGGNRPKPIFVREVQDIKRQPIWKNEIELEPVLEPEVAFLVSNMMRSVVEEGTAKAALVLDREIAGKTGTTNDARSIWFGGFVPDLVTIVYVGYDDNRALGRVSGSSVPLPIWINYMQPLLQDSPVLTFEVPDGIETAKIDPVSGKLAVPGNERWLDEYFLPGTAPTEYAADGTGDIYSDDDDSSGLMEDSELPSENPVYYDEPIGQ